MDVRRYQQSRAHTEDVSISNKTLPGLVVLAVGVIAMISGLILLAAFGVPKDLANHPKRISSIVTLSVGALICLVGIGLSIHLRGNARKEKARQKRQRKEALEQAEQSRRASRAPPVPYTHAQPTTSAGPNYRQEASNARAPFQAYNGGYTETETYGYSTKIDT